MSDNIAVLRIFARDLAEALGAEWTLEPGDRDRHPTLRHAAGYGFLLTGPGWSGKGKRSVHAHYPRDAKGQESRPYFSSWDNLKDPGISFSDTKPAAQAAKDITRRFLPAYLPLWEKQLALVTANNNYRQKRALDAEAAAFLIHGTVGEDRDGQAIVNVPYRGEDNGPRVTKVELNADSVTVTLNLSLNLLGKVQQLLEKESNP